MTTALPLDSYDPAYVIGADNAVNVCLRIQPSEKVTVIADKACLEIAASLADALKRIGVEYHP